MTLVGARLRYLLSALADPKAAGTICRLDMVGSGRIEEDLKQQVARMDLQDEETFHGYVEYGPALDEVLPADPKAIVDWSAADLPEERLLP